jgi:hypothetical protein
MEWRDGKFGDEMLATGFLASLEEFILSGLSQLTWHFCGNLGTVSFLYMDTQLPQSTNSMKEYGQDVSSQLGVTELA